MCDQRKMACIGLVLLSRCLPSLYPAELQSSPACWASLLNGLRMLSVCRSSFMREADQQAATEPGQASSMRQVRSELCCARCKHASVLAYVRGAGASFALSCQCIIHRRLTPAPARRAAWQMQGRLMRLRCSDGRLGHRLHRRHVEAARPQVTCWLCQPDKPPDWDRSMHAMHLKRLLQLEYLQHPMLRRPPWSSHLCCCCSMAGASLPVTCLASKTRACTYASKCHLSAAH